MSQEPQIGASVRFREQPDQPDETTGVIEGVHPHYVGNGPNERIDGVVVVIRDEAGQTWSRRLTDVTLIG